MKPIDERVLVQHGVDVTFVTFNDEEILEEQHVKEIEEEIMGLIGGRGVGLFVPSHVGGFEIVLQTEKQNNIWREVS